MTDHIRKLKGFAVGLSVAGIAALGAANVPISQGSRAGSCGHCGACGLAAVPLVLWLAGKRWKIAARFQVFSTRSIGRTGAIRAIGDSSEEKRT
jgi:hypothetical protein